MQSATISRLPTKRLPTVRSAVSNGSRKFVDANGRTAWARRHSDLVGLYCDDMGDASTLSRAQIALAERAATLEMELQAMEGRLSEGDKTVDLDLFVRATGALNRTLKTMGVQRVARPGARNPLADHFARPVQRGGA